MNVTFNHFDNDRQTVANFLDFVAREAMEGNFSVTLCINGRLEVGSVSINIEAIDHRHIIFDKLRDIQPADENQLHLDLDTPVLDPERFKFVSEDAMQEIASLLKDRAHVGVVQAGTIPFCDSTSCWCAPMHYNPTKDNRGKRETVFDDVLRGRTEVNADTPGYNPAKDNRGKTDFSLSRSRAFFPDLTPPDKPRVSLCCDTGMRSGTTDHDKDCPYFNRHKRNPAETNADKVVLDNSHCCEYPTPCGCKLKRC